ncbi:MAG: hypothetical protein JW966_07920 [Anaerolineae bacterium]|nr:hypothetical protein [Anaerolineae bacterium]
MDQNHIDPTGHTSQPGEPTTNRPADESAADSPAGQAGIPDTKPKAPAGLRDAIQAQQETTGPGTPPPAETPIAAPGIIAPPESLHQRLAAEEPPITILDDTAERSPTRPRRPSPPPVLAAVVIVGTLCMCLMLVTLAGVAGYRDGLATNDAKITQTLATGIAEQYATGVADLDNGYAELAAARFEWIVETIQAPTEYARDSAARLAMARTIAAYTPTPYPTTTFTPSPSPSPTVIPAAPAAGSLTPSPGESTPSGPTAPGGPDPADLYEQASTAMRVAHYEEAIEWLESLMALAPAYRAEETKAMYMEALVTQGRIYLRGQNQDGEDRLARGVLLIYKADEIGKVEPPELLGEAIFVEMYINARSYVNGGNYEAAVPVLQELCSMNCGWSYPSVNGVSVRDLLDQAQSGGGPS